MAETVLVYGGEAHMSRFLERVMRRRGNVVILVGQGENLLTAIEEHAPNRIIVADPALLESARSTVESNRLQGEVTPLPATAMSPEQLSGPLRVFRVCVVLLIIGFAALLWKLSH